MRQAVTSALVALVLLPSAALAVSSPTSIVPSDCNQPGGCKSICDIAALAQNLLDIGIFLAVFLSAILFAWAGWKYLTAGGNPSEISQAKHLFLNVAVGLILILAAWLIVDTLIRTLTNVGNWSALC